MTKKQTTHTAKFGDWFTRRNKAHHGIEPAREEDTIVITATGPRGFKIGRVDAIQWGEGATEPTLKIGRETWRAELRTSEFTPIETPKPPSVIVPEPTAAIQSGPFAGFPAILGLDPIADMEQRLKRHIDAKFAELAKAMRLPAQLTLAVSNGGK